jgi:CHASE2 domain-containing sensor protein
MIWPFRRKTKAKKPVTTRRIVTWALIIGAIVGLLDLTLPLEEIARSARNSLRERPADGQTVVVAVDDRSLARFGGEDFSRKYEAIMIDRVLSMGANRVFFDESFSKELDKEGDDAFAEVLSRYKGRVFLGAIIRRDFMTGKEHYRLPLPKFAEHAQHRSYQAATAPFGLSIEPFYGEKRGKIEYASLSSEMANRAGEPNTRYRPDFAIQHDTVPTISLADVVDEKIPQSTVKGKDIILGFTSESSKDIVHAANQGWIPGVYVHVIGAQTLREGTPRGFGPWPALLVAAFLIMLLVRSRSRQQVNLVIAASLLTALVVPFILESWLITMNYFPAIIAFGIAAYRLLLLREIRNAGKVNAGTLMPNLSALREEPLAASRPIIAMRIRNYAAVGASFAESVEDEFINEIARRLTMPGSSQAFYQAEDVLYWLGPALSKHELEGHIAGLSRLMESLFVVRGRKIDLHVAFGVDTDLTRPVVNRIGRALLAADTAAAKHQPYMFNTSDNDEESAWELSLMSELDEAIDNGDIWIAYQPQFELKGDRISGAEALVRWQHPLRGAISPEAFILPAEAHNRIGRLTFHVLEQATTAARALVETNPGFRLSINISASLMENGDLPARIHEVLERNDFPASNLTLEVTESAPFAEHQAVANNLAQIAALIICARSRVRKSRLTGASSPGCARTTAT